MDKYLGKLLDNRYEILQVIGTGGMAVVYKALCHRLNRLVAVKVLKDEYAKDEDFRNRFHAESQAVAMLSHPNIVSVYDVSRSNSVEYIVMELIDGMTLKQFMEHKGVLTWKESIHFVTQILKALQHAHEKGIIHRDIKPHNIMLLRDGTIKVADFGIARFVATQGTIGNEALGSVHYISPEQARGSHIDTRTDIYSTGVMLYEMITGRLPYEGDSPVSIAVQHINSMPLSPREINPDVPETLERITMKAMCSNINKRYASAEEMLRDLEAFRKNPNIELASDEPDTPEVRDPDQTRVMQAVNDPHAATTTFATTDDWENELLPEKKKGKINFMLISGLVTGAVFLCGVVVLLLTLFGGGGGPDVDAPNLLGKTFEEIMEDDTLSGFEIKEESQEPSDVYEMGQIISQRPEAGKSMKAGGEIYVVVSMGPENKKIPSLANLSERQARIELETKLGLVMQVEKEESDTVPEGYVIRTDPEENTEVKSGDVVTVYLSGGGENTKSVVPSLIGLTRSDAEEEITNAGLKVGTVKSVNSSKKKGTVVYQSVSANSQVERETVINFQISTGETGEEQPETQTPTTTTPQTQTPTTTTPQTPSTTTPKPETPTKPSTPQTPSTPSTTPSGVSKTLTIKLPESPSSFTLTAKINGVTVYSGTHKASEGSATITVTGNGTQSVAIYIDGKLYNEVSVTFD